MGIWWKDVDVIPGYSTGVKFDGVPGAMSKNFPILWRFYQPWVILKVEKVIELEGKKRNLYEYPCLYLYNVCFKNLTQRMVYREKIKSRFIAVRLGPEPVSFYVWVSTSNAFVEKGYLKLTQWSDIFYKEKNQEFFPGKVSDNDGYEPKPLHKRQIVWL